MALKKRDVRLAIQIMTFMMSNESEFSEWYVGIAADAEDRLFNGHSVDKNGLYDFGPASSPGSARIIERILIDNLGTAGGPGGGDDDTDKVYVYKMSECTDP